MNDGMKLFIVMAGYDFDGLCGQWIFTDEAAARAKFDAYAEGLRAEDKKFEGDYISLKGPFAPGEDVHDLGAERVIAACDPGQERREAAHQAALAKRREARRAVKAAAAV